MAKEHAQAAFAEKLRLTEKLRQGGAWLGSLRSWLQSNVINGDRLPWSSGEPVTLPFWRFEEVGLKVAVSAVIEDRRVRGVVSWNKDADLIPEGTPVLIRLKGKKAPVMCLKGTDLSMMLDQDWYGFIVDKDDIEGWLDPETIKASS